MLIYQPNKGGYIRHSGIETAGRVALLRPVARNTSR